MKGKEMEFAVSRPDSFAYRLQTGSPNRRLSATSWLVFLVKSLLIMPRL
jgi:hypothetical protein